MQSKIEFGNLYFWKEIPNPTRDSDKIAPLATQHKLSTCNYTYYIHHNNYLKHNIIVYHIPKGKKNKLVTTISVSC